MCATGSCTSLDTAGAILINLYADDAPVDRAGKGADLRDGVSPTSHTRSLRSAPRFRLLEPGRGRLFSPAASACQGRSIGRNLHLQAPVAALMPDRASGQPTEVEMQMLPPRTPSSTLLRLSAAAIAAACLLSTSASAQPPATPSPGGQSSPSAAIPDQKLDAAATALQKVVDLKQDYQRRIDAASESDKQGIADEAKGALAKAVTDQGLSVEEYTAIIVIAQRDPQVREKILQRLPQSNDSPPGNSPDK
jgi:hypothetical protein